MKGAAGGIVGAMAITAVFGVCACAPAPDGGPDRAATEPGATAVDGSEIARIVRSQLRAEGEHFEAGNCDGALDFFADRELLMVADGRPVESKPELAAACPRMVAARPTGTSRTVTRHVVHVLSATSAYSITEYAAAAGPRFVTKVWTPVDGHWKIVHLHESIRELPPPDSDGGPD